MTISKRVKALEARRRNPSNEWHRLTWKVGQSFDEMIAANNAEGIPPADNIIVNAFVVPAGDPIRDRDMPLYLAWCADRELAVSISKPG